MEPYTSISTPLASPNVLEILSKNSGCRKPYATNNPHPTKMRPCKKLIVLLLYASRQMIMKSIAAVEIMTVSRDTK